MFVCVCVGMEDKNGMKRNIKDYIDQVDKTKA